MNLTKIRLFDALSISYAFHIVVIAIVWSALIFLNQKQEPEKVRIAILLHTPSNVPSTPQQPTPKQIVSEPRIQPKVLPTPTPIKTPPLTPSRPTIATPQPTPITPSVNVQKAVESVPVAVPKAPPPPPKAEENYEEENLGKIRSILAERLKYPKNAVRLKQQGEIVVAFSLEPNREVTQITIMRSSGFEILDNAAKELIETSANEFPKPKKSVRISVPIDYKLR